MKKIFIASLALLLLGACRNEAVDQAVSEESANPTSLVE